MDHHAYNGLCMVIVRAGKKADKIVVKVSAAGLQTGKLELRVITSS
jgi:hypothetical protein